MSSNAAISSDMTEKTKSARKVDEKLASAQFCKISTETVQTGSLPPSPRFQEEIGVVILIPSSFCLATHNFRVTNVCIIALFVLFRHC